MKKHISQYISGAIAIGMLWFEASLFGGFLALLALAGTAQILWYLFISAKEAGKPRRVLGTRTTS